MKFRGGIQELKEAFGAHIEYADIEKVLHSCNGDRVRARTRLQKMVESGNKPTPPPAGKGLLGKDQSVTPRVGWKHKRRFLSPQATRKILAQSDVGNIKRQNYVNNGRSNTCRDFTEHLHKLAATKTPNGMVQIKLHEDSVLELIRLFGPATESAEESKFRGDTTTVVNLPMEFCKTLHQHWAATVNSSRTYENDATMESPSQRFGYSNGAKTGKRCTPKDQPQNKGPLLIHPPESFKNIMEVEKASMDILQIEEGKKDMALKVKLSQLKSEFPNVHPNTVEMTLHSKSYEYDMAKAELTRSFGCQKKKPSPIVIAEDDGNDDNIGSCLSPRSVQELREQAGQHFALKKEALSASAENSRKKNYSAASHYSQVAAHHTKMQLQCNQDAATLILDDAKAAQKDNTLDLHLLHVNEAVNATRNFIAQKAKYVRDFPQKTIELGIITGQGNHSREAPRIKNAITKYLKSSGHQFKEANNNRGMFCVTLSG